MSKIQFITDSAADIPAEKMAGLEIKVLPFLISMNDREYRDCVDFEQREFYQMLLEAEKIPTHSQINPTILMEVFTQAVEAGYTDVIYTSINAKGSATFQNAIMARELFFEEHPELADTFHIYLLDSKSYTYAYGYAVVEGAKLAQAGKEPEEIVAWMQDWIDHVRILFATYSLRFAKKSGRVSAAAAFLGEALGLKPVMSFPDGDSKVLSKVRGDKNVIPTILNMMKEEIAPDSPYIILQGSEEVRNREMVEAAQRLTGYPSAANIYVGGVIAINAGPQLTGIVYRKKD
jgi:DegV family protein with EDD domain